ncbi:MAG: PEP-CTERM sorting domain-containing protein [Verrucomicrobiota bacterium]
MAPDINNDHWRYNSPSYASPLSLNADYATGTYSLLIGGQTISLSMPVGNAGNNFLFPNAPLVTATGAAWQPNGTLLYDASSGPLTFVSNLFSTNAGAIVHLGINIDATSGQPSFNDFSAEAFGSGPSTISQTYSNPGEFISGSTYQVSLEFNNIVDGPFPLSGPLTGGQAVAVYTARTTFNLQVIPEPSTYAALAGASVLVLAAWRRRSRK